MVRCAKALPVALVPEQRLITAVRDLVIDHRGRRHPVLGLAHHAQRMRAQEALARFLPFVAVAALCRCLVAGSPAPCLHRWDAMCVEHGEGRFQRLELVHTLAIHKEPCT